MCVCVLAKKKKKKEKIYRSKTIERSSSFCTKRKKRENRYAKHTHTHTWEKKNARWLKKTKREEEEENWDRILEKKRIRRRWRKKKLFFLQTLGTGWYFCSGETPLVTTFFVVVDVPVAGDLGFFFPRTKNTMARIIPRIHSAIKAAKRIFFVDQPKIIKVHIQFHISDV